jgi:hypothetical protein
MIVGRISIQSLNHFRNIATKTISYERTPLVGDWMERTLVVAGNHADLPPIPVTPVLMSRWLHDKMLDYGYAQADTVFYPPTYPGTSTIANRINAGVQFASYRGWGAADGWHFPLFHYTDAEATTSGRKMPIVTSIVCNTGDFGNSANSNTCFGEVWMRMGSPSEPNGCVAFVGPSDLHTSTEDNNAISSGFYHGVFDENIRSFGAAVLRGKAELYNNYPNNQATGDEVEFYFWVYNLLRSLAEHVGAHAGSNLLANAQLRHPGHKLHRIHHAARGHHCYRHPRLHHLHPRGLRGRHHHPAHRRRPDRLAVCDRVEQVLHPQHDHRERGSLR